MKKCMGSLSLPKKVIFFCDNPLNGLSSYILCGMGYWGEKDGEAVVGK